MNDLNTAARMLPLSEATSPAKAKRTKRVVATANAPAKRRSTKQAQAALSARKRVALCVGAVGCVVLLLSVWHCTEALTLLTGAPLLLAALLAIGIDCGLVACEVATVVGDTLARNRARVYVGLAVALSAVLNAVASAQHAASEFALLAYAVGALVPVLVLLLGQVASHLWTE